MAGVQTEQQHLTVTEFVAFVMQCLREKELGVPAAVADTWDRYASQLDNAAVAELARAGAEGRIHRALSEERFTRPQIIAPARPSERVLRVAPVTREPRRAQTVRFHMLDVPYTGRDNRVYPLRKFILTDVDAVIERLTRTVDGATRVKEWFGRVRDALVANGADRVGDLPEGVLRELNESSPFATD